MVCDDLVILALELNRMRAVLRTTELWERLFIQIGGSGWMSLD